MAKMKKWRYIDYSWLETEGFKPFLHFEID